MKKSFFKKNDLKSIGKSIEKIENSKLKGSILKVTGGIVGGIDFGKVIGPGFTRSGPVGN